MRILLIDDSGAYHEEFAQLLIDLGIRFSALDRSPGRSGRPSAHGQ